MCYTVTTFKVRLEVCDVGDRTGASDDVIRVAKPIFAELDASVCARLETRSSCNVTGFLSGFAIVLPHLITLSARTSTFGGIVRPICFAVLRLITSSNFVGCSTGRSAGLAPFRILST
jgi:hypothetical protein